MKTSLQRFMGCVLTFCPTGEQFQTRVDNYLEISGRLWKNQGVFIWQQGAVSSQPVLSEFVYAVWYGGNPRSIQQI